MKENKKKKKLFLYVVKQMSQSKLTHLKFLFRQMRSKEEKPLKMRGCFQNAI